MEPPTNFNFVFAELLPEILLHSPTSDLVVFRLVSRQWRQAATTALHQRGDLKVHFLLTRRNPFRKNPTFYSFKAKIRKAAAEYCYSECSICDMPEDLNENKSLPSLFRLVTSSPHQIASSFPVNHFDFKINHHEVVQPQLASFVQGYGPKIKAISLDSFAFPATGHQEMIYSILQYTPNLELLCFRESFTNNPPERVELDKNDRIFFPHLKAIEICHKRIDDQYRYAAHNKPIFWILPPLLERAPQLQRIFFKSYFEPKLAEPFLPSRINLLDIETLHLSDEDLFSNDVETLENWVKVMVTSPQAVGLKHLRLRVKSLPQTLNSWKRGRAALRRIMEANANSISKIDLIAGAASVLHKIPDLPILPKVFKLKVNLERSSIFSSFANPGQALDFAQLQDENSWENSLSELFPNLETLDLFNWHDQEEDSPRKCFPFWNDKLLGVKTLKAQSFASDCYAPYPGNNKGYALSLQLCPEIKSFATWWLFREVSLLLQPLWKLTQLTSLHLELIVPYDENGATFIDLDAAITGLSKRAVSAIYNNWERCGQWDVVDVCEINKDGDEDWTIERVSSSILDLQNLQKLHLEVRFNRLEYKPRIIVSGVSAKFGFNLMKKLKVLVVFRFGGAAISPPDVRQQEREWLHLHSPLSSFSNVIVSLKEDLDCCTIQECSWLH